MEPTHPEELRARYEGGPEPEPPYSADDPFGFTAFAVACEESREQGPLYEDEEEYEAAYSAWLEAAPLKMEGFFLLDGGQSCPVCTCPEGEMPGCYVPYGGRRWDCFEYWGRHLNGGERRRMIEHAKLQPRSAPLKLQLPTSS